HQPTSMMELTINKDSWDALPDDLKAIVEEAAKASVLEGLGHTLTKDAEALTKFEEYGTEIRRLSPEVMQQVATLAHELYEKKSAEHPLCKKYYDSQMEYQRKFEHIQQYIEIRY